MFSRKIHGLAENPDRYPLYLKHWVQGVQLPSPKGINDLADELDRELEEEQSFASN
jgi:hypothetical protein